MFANTGFSQLPKHERRQRLWEVARLFLKLGFVAFGGPAAHIAMMEDEFVKKRSWLTRETFMDLLGATNLIPGPNSTEMAIHLGFLRGGVAGLFIAGAAFILPAMSLVLLFAFLYVRFGALPEISGILYGIKPVIMAIILQALYRLSKTAIKNTLAAGLGIAVIALSFLGIGEIPLLLGAGIIATVAKNRDKFRRKTLCVSVLPASLLLPKIAALFAGAAAMPLLSLFLVFLKIGSVLYGSGYVLLAFLEAEFVRNLAVLSSRQILDAVAIGQFTPGPVFTTATFIGYLIGGVPGAVVSTIGIFLPSFLFVFLLNPVIPKMRASSWFGGLLDGVNAASLGLMATVTVKLGVNALNSPFTLILFLISFLIIMKTKVNTVFLIIGGGALGLVWQMLI